MIKRSGLYALVSLIAIVVYLPGITDSFLADDWLVINGQLGVTLQDILMRFITTYDSWYRPMFYLVIAFCVRIFGFNVSGYHFVALLLYLIITYLVGDIAETITGSRLIGLTSSFLFGIHGVHAEPVLWIAAMNELVAGLFVLLSLKSYLIFRKAGQPVGYYVLTGLLYFLSLASKETAFFLPLALVGHDFFLWKSATDIKHRFDWRAPLPHIPLLIMLTTYLALRLSSGSPYSMAVPLFRVLANALYYLAVQLFLLPDNYGYWSSLALWQQSPWLPLIALGISTLFIGMVSWFYLKFSRESVSPEPLDALKFTACWSILALLPVILTATGRTAFLSSIGLAWSMAIILFMTWQNIKTRQIVYRSVFVMGIVVFVCLNLVVSSYRVYWWRRASETTQNVLNQLDRELEKIPQGETICVLGLPDHLNHAYTFRNAFPYAGSIVFPAYDIYVTLDTALNNPTEINQDCITYVYEHNRLRRDH